MGSEQRYSLVVDYTITLSLCVSVSYVFSLGGSVARNINRTYSIEFVDIWLKSKGISDQKVFNLDSCIVKPLETVSPLNEGTYFVRNTHPYFVRKVFSLS